MSPVQTTAMLASRAQAISGSRPHRDESRHSLISAATTIDRSACRCLHASVRQSQVPRAAGENLHSAPAGSWDREDDLAELLAGFEALVRRARLGEREHAVDDRPRAARARPARRRPRSPPACPSSSRRSSAASTRSGAARPAGSARSSRRRRRCGPPARAASSESLPRRLADVLDDDVGAAAGDLLHARGDVVRRVVDRRVGAELARPLELRVARRRDDRRARRAPSRSRAPPSRRRRRCPRSAPTRPAASCAFVTSIR